MGNGIRYKTIIKNKTLSDFTKEEKIDKSVKPSSKKKQ